MVEKRVWSDYQQAIFRDVREGVGNTVVIARAGASKTTSLVESVRYIPRGLKTLFLAFNKSIAEELDSRIDKSYVDTKTNHSLGMTTIRNHFGQIAVDPEKTNNLIKLHLKELGMKDADNGKAGLVYSLNRAVNLCKGGLIDTPSKIDVLLDRYDLDTFELRRDEFIKAVCQVLRKCKEMKMVVDFGDMVYFPFVFNLKPPQYDRVFLDEAQDCNPAQINLGLSACKKHGRILVACDDRQVLYSFNSVDLDVVEKLVKRLNAKVLRLPISYRCAKQIIKMANEIVPDIVPAPNAIEGAIHRVSEDDFLSLVKPGDFVLSRTNAPLIHYCMELLVKKVPANIQGRDVGNGLAYMIKRSQVKTVPEFLQWLEEWKLSEIERLKTKRRDTSLVEDKAMCMEHLCRGAKSLEQVQENIKQLFKEGSDLERVIASTVHRAKGLERDRVFVITRTFKPTMNKEEGNIWYVAVSRAKKELFLVE